MVQTLNLILLTAPELVEVKNSLRSVSSEHSKDLFSILYRYYYHSDSFAPSLRPLNSSWCYNEAAVFSLCLLAQVYEHACMLIYQLYQSDKLDHFVNLFGVSAEFELTVNTLMEMDKLVQLLESPIFLSLRLQLLEPQRY